MLRLVAIAAPVIPHPNQSIITGSSMTLSMFPKIWPIIAAEAWFSARIIPPLAMLKRINGVDATTIDR